MAGGQNTFVAGNVLTAAQLNAYLMDQSVMRVTSGTRPTAAAQGGGLVEGMVIYETDTDRILAYSGTAWVIVAGDRGELRIARTAGQAISTTTVTSISWDTETTDTLNFFSASSTTAATIPANYGGRYLISVNCTFTGAPSTRDFMNITVGTRTYVFPGNATEQTLSATVSQRMTAGETISVSVFQQSGSTRGIQGTLEMERTTA